MRMTPPLYHEFRSEEGLGPDLFMNAPSEGV
jgi:hypothetical protein